MNDHAKTKAAYEAMGKLRDCAPLPEDLERFLQRSRLRVDALDGLATNGLTDRWESLTEIARRLQVGTDVLWFMLDELRSGNLIEAPQAALEPTFG